MKRLYLLRHAKSSWAEGALDDFERPLNERGERDAPMMGKRLRRRGLVPERIVSSAAVRTYTTARLVARELRYPVADVVRDEELYQASAAGLLARAQGMGGGVASLMLVAHNPGITELANALTEHRIAHMPTCGLYCVDFDVERWRDLARGGGTFVLFDYPKNTTDA